VLVWYMWSETGINTGMNTGIKYEISWVCRKSGSSLLPVPAGIKIIWYETNTSKNLWQIFFPKKIPWYPPGYHWKKIKKQWWASQKAKSLQHSEHLLGSISMPPDALKKLLWFFVFLHGLRDPEFVLLAMVGRNLKTFGFFYHGTYLSRCWFTQQGVFVLLWWCGVLYDGSCCGWCMQGFSELFWCPDGSMFGGAKSVEFNGFQSFHVGTSGDYALKNCHPLPLPLAPNYLDACGCTACRFQTLL